MDKNKLKSFLMVAVPMGIVGTVLGYFREKQRKEVMVRDEELMDYTRQVVLGSDFGHTEFKLDD